MGIVHTLPGAANGFEVTDYIAIHDSTAASLSRKTAPSLRDELRKAAADAGAEMLLGYASWSRDELVTTILELRFPDIARARQVRAGNMERNAAQ